jgi:hypothetical protein
MTQLVMNPGVVNGAGGYNIPYSVLMDGANHYLSRNPSVAAASRRKGFLSVWFRIASRIGDTDPHPYLYEGYYDSNNRTAVSISSDKLYFIHTTSGTAYGYYIDPLFRDPAKYYHVYIEWDTTQVGAGDRVKIWINGVQRSVTASGAGAIPQNSDLFLNHTVSQLIGRSGTSTSYHFSGNIAEVALGDNVTNGGPDGFGKFDNATSEWVPKNYAGSFGTNGSRLRFRDGTSTTTLGYDDSGNGNHWTLNNMATTDRLTDSPTNTYAIWNALHGSAAISEGGLLLVASIGSQLGRFATIPCLSKVHAEFVCGDASGGNNNWIGIVDAYDNTTFAYSSDGNYYNGSGWSAYGAAYNNSDRITVEFDPSSGTLEFFKGGASQGQKTVPSDRTYILFGMAYHTSGPAGWIANFGQKPFIDTPTAGFKGLSTKSMPSPPVRKASTMLASDFKPETDIEAALAAQRVSWSNYVDILKNCDASESWAWRFSHDAGNEYAISASTSTRQANRAMAGSQNWLGHSIRVGAAFGTAAGSVSHTSGAATIVSHNLGNSRCVIFLFGRAGNLAKVYHPDLTAGELLDLLTTAGDTADTTITAVGTNSFSIGSSAATGTYDYLVLTETSGCVWIGKWDANASADGPNPWMGVSPELFVCKAAANAVDWQLYSRQGVSGNVNDRVLFPNLADGRGAAGSGYNHDLLSGGVKVRLATLANASGARPVGMAIGNPTKYANAR